MDMAISTAQMHAHPAHQPLGIDSRLRFDAAACLPVRFPASTCGICIDACPVAALELVDRVPVASGEACIGCGQCCAACPTAALETDGFALPTQAPTNATVLYIDCWRVPLSASPPGAWRVPCLGGISTGWLLSLFDRLAEQQERPICLLDRGACAGCPAGPGSENFHAALDEARALLAACGVDAAVLPVLTFEPARQTLTPSIPTTASAQPMGRRGFLRNLVGSTARTIDNIRTSAAPVADITLHRAVLPVENLRIATALANIARRHGRAAPARALPQLSIADCAAHGVCAKVCPTGALRRDEVGDTAELRFNAALCIACGQCARICPDGSLRLTPEGGHAGSETLIRWSAQDCAACGEAFFGTAGDTCPACRKNQDLLEEAATLFGQAA
jgi:ferredoxin